jgi:hypothetical protein
MRHFIILLVYIICITEISAQEYLTGVGSNPVKQEISNAMQPQTHLKSQFISTPSVNLPFYDDFSEITIYPDTSRWIDNEAFINANFPYYPVNYGVATLDVLDSRGNVYPWATTYTFEADRLTSKPIRLDSVFDPTNQTMKALTPADSVYFSFYYQPQGRGDNPLKHDSLVLEFGYFNTDTVFSHLEYTEVFGYEYLNPGELFLPPFSIIQPPFGCDTSLWYILSDTLFYDDSILIPCDSVFKYGTDWTRVWGAEGDSLESFIDKYGVFFKYVVIPVVDEELFRHDFQFRFKNYASISNINSWKSNTDQWHIDVVWLDWNRRISDRFMKEVSFVEDPQGFIVDYSSMPYNQYSGNITGLKRESFDIHVHNLDSVTRNIHYNYFVQNAQGDTLPAFLYEGFTGLINSHYSQNIFEYQPFVKPPVKYFFTSLSQDTADFRITHIIQDVDDPAVGDTIVYNQEFRNYLAYDDGSAEAGYGLAPSGARLAVKFRTEVVDTLRGVKMYFNKTFGSYNNRLFHICVWNDNNGKPGNLIYTMENVRPVFSDQFNQFHTYEFPEFVNLGVGNFYVGWTQTSNDNLNIGFDRNTNTKTRNFYNVDGSWVNSSFDGSIMIRPVLGKALSQQFPEGKSNDSNELVIYPNPPIGTHEIFVSLPPGLDYPGVLDYLTLRVIDIYGRTLVSGPYRERLSTLHFKPGLYIVNLVDALQGESYSTKLLIVK